MLRNSACKILLLGSRGTANRNYGTKYCEFEGHPLQLKIPINRDLAYTILQRCERSKNLELGRQLQCLMCYSGLDSLAALNGHLIRLFTHHGILCEANQLFNKIAIPTPQTWGANIFSNSKLGHGEIALELYNNMLLSGTENDKYICVAILKGCTITNALFQGRILEDLVLKSGLYLDVYVGSTLVDMYAKCGCLEEARQAFDKLPNRNVVLWNTMITAYAQHVQGFTALKCFHEMQEEGLKPDGNTFSSICNACASIGAIEQGRRVHVQILESGIESDIVVGNTLIDMYIKCGSINDAQKVFDVLAHRNITSWGAMIAGFANQGGSEALECFDDMQKEGIKPNIVTFLSILKACSKIGALEQGHKFHGKIVSSGLALDIVVGSTMVDMYTKCGSLDDARKLFNNLPNRNVVSWNAMIAGYAQHGEGILAIECFEEMQQKGIKPNESSLVSILIACSRAGLVDKGHWYFKTIREYGIIPTPCHCSCMVDLLCRAGCLEEAEDLLQVTSQTNIMAWKALLSACRRHGIMEIAKHCFDQIVYLDPDCAAGYVLLAHMYAHVQKDPYIFFMSRWEDSLDDMEGD